MKSFREELKSLDSMDRSQCQDDVEEFTAKFFGRKYTHFKPLTYRNDKTLVQILRQVEREYKEIFPSKPDQVRIEQWARKLCEDCLGKAPLMKNRNKYAKLLKTCVFDIGRLEGVFKKMPRNDGEDLKLIQNFEILEIEHLASNNKRKKSAKRAADMYEYNKEKAKEEMRWKSGVFEGERKHKYMCSIGAGCSKENAKRAGVRSPLS